MISLVLGTLGIILMLLRLNIYCHNGHKGIICFLDFLIILAEYAAYFTGGNFLYNVCALIWCFELGSDCTLLCFIGKHK